MSDNSAPNAPDTMSVEALESYWQWWQEQGVEQDYAETPHGWLETEAPPKPAVSQPQEQPRLARQQAVSAPSPAPAANADASIVLPDSMDALLSWWAETDALKTQSGIGPRIAPTLKPSAKLLIISDMPDEDDSETLFSGTSGAMLDRILAAINIERDNCAIASILPQYCADPESELGNRPFWRKLIAHQIKLLHPEYVILCSKVANLAVTDTDLAENRRSLRFVNHEGHNIPASATFHPRILVKTPAMKRAAWRDWLRLKGLMNVENTDRI